MVRIDLIGDSTQTNNAGYGRGFCANVTAKVDCVNMAKGGASTKTFREQGLWDRSLQTKPDYVLVLPWNLRDEISEQLAYVRSWGGRLVFPIPALEVV